VGEALVEQDNDEEQVGADADAAESTRQICVDD